MLSPDPRWTAVGIQVAGETIRSERLPEWENVGAEIELERRGPNPRPRVGPIRRFARFVRRHLRR